MDLEDFAPKKSDSLTALETEDLSTLSIDELEERARRLGAEIARAEAMAVGKRAGKDAADAMFKS
jgi:uncharacterized small protein (DUF1192 family)